MRKVFLIFILFLLIFENAQAAAKHKKAKPVKAVPHVAIPSEKFLQIDLAQSGCEVMIATDDDSECARRDHMRDEIYYHKTKITIFRNKIFAEQFSKNSENATDRMFLKIKNGNYKIKSHRGNRIFLSIKNGIISKMELISGSWNEEKEPQSDCQITEAIYGFYQAYDSAQILASGAFIVNDENFEGLQEFFTFVNQKNPRAVMAMGNKINQTPSAIKDVTVCRMADKKYYSSRHFAENECAKYYDDSAAECYEYKDCENYLVVKNCQALLIKEIVN